MRRFVLLLAAVPLWQIELAMKVGIATIRKSPRSVQSAPSVRCENGQCPTPSQLPSLPKK